MQKFSTVIPHNVPSQNDYRGNEFYVGYNKLTGGVPLKNSVSKTGNTMLCNDVLKYDGIWEADNRMVRRGDEVRNWNINGDSKTCIGTHRFMQEPQMPMGGKVEKPACGWNDNVGNINGSGMTYEELWRKTGVQYQHKFDFEDLWGYAPMDNRFTCIPLPVVPNVKVSRSKKF